MSRVRRVIAPWCAVTIALCTLLAFPVVSRAATPADHVAASAAVAWITTPPNQQSDGGFEVAGYSGFETRDASLAIAEAAQTDATWSTTEAINALAALEYGGPGGPTPLDALDAYAADIASDSVPGSAAGAAAKTILLSAQPLGLDPAAFDAAGDGSPVDLAAALDDQCNLLVFSDILYGMLANVTVCGSTPAQAAAIVRTAQQGDGGWAFNGDPSATGFDADTTGLAIQALVATGASGTDPAVVAALHLAALSQQGDGGWIDFFGAESNASSSAIVVLAVEAAGYDPTSSCWRNTAAPSMASTAYADPIAWMRSQQDPDGHIASPYDIYGVNTLTTSQSVHALLSNRFPVRRATAQTCAVTPPVVVPGVPNFSGPAPAAEVVSLASRFTG
jgi:hypothetical protein